MKLADKAKAQTVVNEILTGNFNERTVEELFMRLRDSSHGIFRDFGHYMAHSRERDKGMAVEQLSAAYCSFKAFDKYHRSKHKFDLNELPTYMIDYFHHQTDALFALDKKGFKRKFGDPKKCHEMINQIFKLENDRVNTTRPPTADEINFILSLTGLVGSEPIYKHKDVIKSVISTIKQNELKINEQQFKLQGDKFILCLMCKLHDTLHKVADRTVGLCKIGFVLDRSGGHSLENLKPESFKLTLGMRMVLDCIDGEIKIQFPLLDTDLLAVDHCLDGDITVFIDEDPQSTPEVFMTPDSDSYFAVGHDCKLERIKAEA